MACYQFRKVSHLDRKGKSPEPDIPTRDPLVGSDLVVGLSRKTFRSYLKNWDIAMVMFYQDNDRLSVWGSKHFKLASSVAQRPRHAFAAINCTLNEDFCLDQGIANLPFFKMYSKGEDVGSSNNPRKLTFEDMKMWLEKFPVVLPIEEELSSDV